MLRVCVLGSGSTGNATWVEGPGGAAILIDAGLGPKVLEERMRAAGRSPSQLAAIFITHEHTDHASGLVKFSRKHGIPAYASQKLLKNRHPYFDVPVSTGLRAGEAVDVAGFSVTPVPISHDTIDPFAFRIEAADVSFGYVTDTGIPTPRAMEGLRDCHGLVVEFNHDLDMLQNGAYKTWLKERVAGRKGHLSNAQAGEFLAGILHDGCSEVFLAHLSQKNNTPRKAMESAREACVHAGFSPNLHLTHHAEPTEVVEIRGAA